MDKPHILTAMENGLDCKSGLAEIRISADNCLSTRLGQKMVLCENVISPSEHFICVNLYTLTHMGPVGCGVSFHL